MEERFGIEGGAVYNAYKGLYNQIVAGMRSGRIEQSGNPFASLQKKMIEEVEEVQNKRLKFKKRMIFSMGLLAALVLLWLAEGGSSNELVVVAILGFPAPAWAMWRQKVHNQRIDAIIDFDKEHFQGAVMDAWRNKLSIRE